MLREGPTGDWIGTFVGHKGAVWSCALNDSATLAATASADFTAKVWDALTGLEKHSFAHGHIVRTVSFAHYGNRMVTGGAEKVLRLFDLARPDAEPSKGAAQAASGVRHSAWVANDTLVLTACTDTPGVGVWDTRTLSQVRTLATDAPVQSLDVTFCGRFVTATDGRTVRFWDTATLGQLKQHTLDYPVEAASFCPAKGKFAAGGGDMWVRLHSYETGAELECCRGHHGPVHTVRFGPEGREYATGSEDGTIRIWQTDWLEMQAAAAANNAADAAAAAQAQQQQQQGAVVPAAVEA
jgi:serine-threonine kinase receptor-associated protein